MPLVLWLLFARSAKTRIGPTWDCGLRGLTPQMEYTATGFSKPIRMIFKALFRPRREVQREYDFSPYFAKTLRFESHVEEVFETRIYRPLNRLVLRVSRRMRALQAGSIQAYLHLHLHHAAVAAAVCAMNLDLLAIAAANAAAAAAGAAGERLHQELEGQAAEPPRPAHLAALLRPRQVPAQGHGHLRARLVDFSVTPYVLFHHRAAGGSDGADGHGASAAEPVRRRAGGGRACWRWAGSSSRWADSTPPAPSAAWAAAAK